MKVDLRRLPVRAVRRGPLTYPLPAPPAAVLCAAALGFAGAREEDRSHWLSAFRRLLDALDTPLQVLIRARPGPDVDPRLPSGALAVRDRSALRRADIAFADHLARRREAVERQVVFAMPRAAEGHVRQMLGDLALGSRAESRPEPIHGEERHDAFVDAGGWHRSWFLERFPGLELEPGWLIDLLPADLTLDLTYHVVPLPTAWMIQHLQRRLAAFRATRFTTGGSDVHVEGALPAAEELQKRLAASQERAFRVALYITLTAPSREALAEGSSRVEQAARGVLAGLQPLIFEMAAGRLATLAAGHDPLSRGHVLDTSALTTLFPWRDAELRHPDGFVVGKSRATARPVVVDPFDHRLFANANIGVFGHSGAGKTFLLSSLALGAYASGTQVFVLDPEHEYGALSRMLGGEDVRLALGSGHALNVLPSIADPGAEAVEEILGPAVADAVDLVAIIAGGLDEAERAEVERAARAAYQDEAQPLLGHVARRLPPGRSRTVLERWVEGSLGAMFSRPTNVDLDADFVVFGMRELRDELVAPVHFLLAEALWTRIKGRGRRRLLLIDELGLLFEDPTLRRFVVALARRIRKYNGALVFATQNPGDLLASEAGSVVATNPAVHFFGAARPGEAARLQQAFQLSPAQRTMVETARRGEFLLAAGAERLSVLVTAPSWQAELIEAARGAVNGAGAQARAPPARQ